MDRMISLCPKCEQVFRDAFVLEQIPNDGAAKCGHCGKTNMALTRYVIAPKKNWRG